MTDRIRLIDALRGIALAGIAVAHFREQYLGFMPPADHRSYAVSGVADGVVEALVQLFVIGKGFGLFSLMFGLSFALQMQRAERRDPKGDFRPRFAWRLLILFAIGSLHGLLYSADILTIYAAFGLPLILFYRVPGRWLLALALVLALGTPRLVERLVRGPIPLEQQKVMQTTMEKSAVERWQALTGKDLGTFEHSNLTDGLRSRWAFQFGLFSRGYQTFALFLVGLWLGRHRILEDVAAHRALLKRVLRWTAGLLIGLPLLVAAIVAAVQLLGRSSPPAAQGAFPDLSGWPVLLGFCVYDTWNAAMTLMYVTAFALLWQRPKWQALLRRLAPVGQMALTSYVAQSAIGVILFYGIGLGLLGKLGNTVTVPLGLLVFAVEAAVCAAWLRHFRYGPLEWCWRSLTWLRLQPFRIVERPARAA